MKGKLVYDEMHRGLGVKIYAKYLKRGGIFIGDIIYEGAVLITCVILRDGVPIREFDNDIENNGYLGKRYWIEYSYVDEKHGFLGMRRKTVPIHISDEYTRVFPKIVKKCKKEVEELLHENEIKIHEELVTDGLPGSLLELDRDKWEDC